MLSKENEAKVFILYMMDCIGVGLCYEDIWELAQECGFSVSSGYFDFAEIFSKLVQENNVREYENSEDEGLYFVTERGKTIADNLGDLIPTAIKDKCAVCASRMIEMKKLDADFYSEIESQGGGYRFIFGIKTKSGDIFNASLLVKEESTAEKMRMVFSERPGYIYRYILGMMTGEVDFIL